MSDANFIVGDAGGTSTHWRVVKGDQIEQFQTIGFNAYTHDLEDLKQNITQTLLSHVDEQTKIYLYAAGIDTQEQKKETEQDLESIFGKSLEVSNDLVGAARALCGDKPGNVCILGTGANACYYDGKIVDKVSASLGYVLGDEGSGGYLGKKLLMRVFRKQISPDIIAAFNTEFEINSHQVIQRIYYKPRPNHFLASFAPFLLKNKSHPDVHQMICDAFDDFFNAFYQQPELHRNTTFHFSGSIAYFFSDILRQVASDKGFNIQHIVQSPISGLVLYHKEHG